MTTYEILLRERETGGTQRCRRCGREVSLRCFFMRYDGWATVCMGCLAADRDLDAVRRAAQIEERMARGWESKERMKWARGGEVGTDTKCKELKRGRVQNRGGKRKPLWTR